MRVERQVKIRGGLSSADLQRAGADRLSQCDHVDIYLAGGGIRCIRQEGDSFHYTDTSEELNHDSFVRVREVDDNFLTRKQARALRHKHGELLRIVKSRTLWALDESVVAVDEVQELGDFVEIRAPSEKGIESAIERLELSGKETIKRTYLDLMLERNLSPLHIKLIRFHDKVGVLTFGIVSGVLTTLGLLIGVVASKAEVGVVLAGILSIALADSVSDSFGIYLSKKAEGVKSGNAVRHALGTFAGKLVLPLTFMIPFLAASIAVATAISLVWGAFLLALLSAEQAFMAKERIIPAVLRHLGLALLVVAATAAAGHLISLWTATL